MAKMISRRRSEPVPLSGGPARGPVDWTPSPREGGGLFGISEAGESRIQLEGVHGIGDTQFREISLLDQRSTFER